LTFIVQNIFARTILSIVGIALLSKLTWEAFRDFLKGANLGSGSAASQRGDFATGVVLSLGNPLNIIFWTGIGVTAFSSIPGQPQPVHLVTFFVAFMSGAFLWCFFLAGLVAWGERFVTPGFFRWVNLVCGLALAYFALQLGWQVFSYF
jgi:threonine/homoserine/homoserine lactone efflux protein